MKAGKIPLRNSTEPTFKLKFYTCDKTVQAAQLRKQVEVMQQAYAGKLTCESPVYDPPHGDTEIRFEGFADGDLEAISDPMCGDCENNFLELMNKFAAGPKP